MMLKSNSLAFIGGLQLLFLGNMHATDIPSCLSEFQGIKYEIRLGGMISSTLTLDFSEAQKISWKTDRAFNDWGSLDLNSLSYSNSSSPTYSPRNYPKILATKLTNDVGSLLEIMNFSKFTDETQKEALLCLIRVFQHVVVEELPPYILGKKTTYHWFLYKLDFDPPIPYSTNRQDYSLSYIRLRLVWRDQAGQEEKMVIKGQDTMDGMPIEGSYNHKERRLDFKIFTKSTVYENLGNLVCFGYVFNDTLTGYCNGKSFKGKIENKGEYQDLFHEKGWY